MLTFWELPTILAFREEGKRCCVLMGKKTLKEINLHSGFFGTLAGCWGRYLGPSRSFWHFTSHIDQAVPTSEVRLGLMGTAFVTEIRFSMSFTWWFISLHVLLGLDMLLTYFFQQYVMSTITMYLRTDSCPALNLRFIHSSLLSLHCGRHWWHKKGV